MARIFLALALFAVGLLFANIVLGYMSGDFNALAQQHRAAHRALDLANKGEDPAAQKAAEAEFERTTDAFRPRAQYKVLHFLLGVLSALVVVLVNSITITYFIGTTRWCREVCDAYQLPDEFPAQSERLKKQSFPWAVLGICTMLGIVVLGAAADPSSDIASSPQWVAPHYLAAIGGSCLIAFAFFMQIAKIGANYEVIASIVGEVRRIRAEKGLDDAEDAAAPDQV